MTDTRLDRFVLGTATNYMRFGVMLAVWIGLTPVIVREAGVEAFGLWALLSAVFGAGSLLDLGMSSAIVKYVGDARGRDDPDRRNRIVSTLAATYLCLAVASGAIIWCALRLLPPPATGSQALQDTAVAVATIFAARLVLVTLPLSLFRSILFGEQLVHLANLVLTITTLCFGVAAWLALMGGFGLVGLAWTSLAVVTVEHLGYIWMAFRRIPDLRVSWRLARPDVLRDIGSFSLHGFVVGIGAVVLLRADPLIVTLFHPLAAVGSYAIAMKVAEQAYLLLKQGVNVLAPIIAELHSRHDAHAVRTALLSGTKFALAPAVMLLLLVVAYGDDALTLWVGPGFAEVWPVLVVLTTAVVLSVPQLLATTVLTMAGHHQIPARAAVLSVGMNLSISLLLARPMGLVGIALGTLVTAVVVDVLIVVRVCCRLHDLRRAEYLRTAIWPHVCPAGAAVLLLSVLAMTGAPGSILGLACRVAPVVLTYGGVFWRCSLTPAEKCRLATHIASWTHGRPATVGMPAGAAS